MSGAIVEATGLGFAIRGKALLADANLSFAEGSFTAILGPNGAGKSTLLRLLVGVLKPSGGTVHLQGEELDSIPRMWIARMLSYLPQNSATRFDLTVWDAVAMGRFPHRKSWQSMTAGDLDVVHDALARVDIAGLSQRTLPTLSGGELQRVFLARALAQEAGILVLDEPTHSLDVRHQLELMDLLTGLHEEGKTIIVAMHELNLVWNTVPDCVLLDGGRVVQAGPSRETLLTSASAEVFGVRIDETPDGLRCRRRQDA